MKELTRKMKMNEIYSKISKIFLEIAIINCILKYLSSVCTIVYELTLNMNNYLRKK